MVSGKEKKVTAAAVASVEAVDGGIPSLIFDQITANRAD